MTRLSCAALLGALIVASPSAQTPPTPTADQIVSKYIDAIGGRTALEKVTSMSATGTLSVPDAGITGDIQLYAKAPNKTASIVTINGMDQVEAFDGTVGWASDSANGVRVKVGVELADAKVSAVFNKELQMKTVYPTMNVSGPEKVDGRDAWLIEASPAEGSPVKLYYDVESGLLVRQVLTRITPMGPLEVDVRLGDYRVVNGIKRAHTVRQLTSMFTAVIQLTNVQQNPAIDEAVFKKPGA